MKQRTQLMMMVSDKVNARTKSFHSSEIINFRSFSPYARNIFSEFASLNLIELASQCFFSRAQAFSFARSQFEFSIFFVFVLFKDNKKTMIIIRHTKITTATVIINQEMIGSKEQEKRFRFINV